MTATQSTHGEQPKTASDSGERRYATVNPFTGETEKEFDFTPTEQIDGDRRAGARRVPAVARAPGAGARGGRAPRGRAHGRAPRRAVRAHHHRDGQAQGGGDRRAVPVLDDPQVLRRQRPRLPRADVHHARSWARARPSSRPGRSASCWPSSPGTTPSTRSSASPDPTSCSATPSSSSTPRSPRSARSRSSSCSPTPARPRASSPTPSCASRTSSRSSPTPASRA